LNTRLGGLVCLYFCGNTPEANESAEFPALPERWFFLPPRALERFRRVAPWPAPHSRVFVFGILHAVHSAMTVVDGATPAGSMLVSASG
jgi:hypothetical protein